MRSTSRLTCPYINRKFGRSRIRREDVVKSEKTAPTLPGGRPGQTLPSQPQKKPAVPTSRLTLHREVPSRPLPRPRSRSLLAYAGMLSPLPVFTGTILQSPAKVSPHKQCVSWRERISPSRSILRYLCFSSCNSHVYLLFCNAFHFT